MVPEEEPEEQPPKKTRSLRSSAPQLSFALRAGRLASSAGQSEPKARASPALRRSRLARSLPDLRVTFSEHVKKVHVPSRTAELRSMCSPQTTAMMASGATPGLFFFLMSPPRESIMHCFEKTAKFVTADDGTLWLPTGERIHKAAELVLHDTKTETRPIEYMARLVHIPCKFGYRRGRNHVVFHWSPIGGSKDIQASIPVTDLVYTSRRYEELTTNISLPYLLGAEWKSDDLLGITLPELADRPVFYITPQEIKDAVGGKPGIELHVFTCLAFVIVRRIEPKAQETSEEHRRKAWLKAVSHSPDPRSAKARKEREAEKDPEQIAAEKAEKERRMALAAKSGVSRALDLSQ